MKKISIITPTHNNQFLRETYDSIKDQDFFEWIIVRNEQALKQNFSFLTNDKRVKIYDLDIHCPIIGSLKRFACSKASGDIILELDHDDLLLPTAIKEVEKAFQDKEIGFVYSNCAYFNNQDFSKPQRFNPAYGWRWREFEYRGYWLDEIVSFPPTPASISRVWFAPDHLRAWRKDIYWQVGGHNKEMRVLDDHELIIRMYLATKFYHIDKCLYLYRIHQTNSWAEKERNKEIQEGTLRLYDQYIYKLCERWCELNNLPKIDLGGRFNSPNGYKSVDIKNADIILDLTKKWALKDNSVGLIRAHDILEHLPDKHFTMSEIYRVLVPGGYLLSLTPSAMGQGAYQDPTHKSFWVRNSFYYYTKKDQAWYIDNDKIKFITMRLEEYYPNIWAKQNEIIYIKADLIKIPSRERVPGIVEI